MIGSDYDGTYQFLTPQERNSVEIIITGADYTNYGRFYDDGVHIPVYWNPALPGEKELIDIVSHKANVINKLNVTTYFEDQPAVIALLKLMCSKCKFIRIEGKV